MTGLDRGDSAGTYDAVWREVYGDLQGSGPVHRHLRRLLAGLLTELDYHDALDVGCGAGHNFSLLRAGGRAPQVAGADVSPEALARARHRAPDAELHRLDIERGSLPRTWELV
ncbi:MAG TPA: class I SAM-dependent methyltransferase, partial [Solirubrobacteraceae bacterium]|nr:class I SAM-dependent methyltransferase [Solirubrobacteraceae bacterium]